MEQLTLPTEEITMKPLTKDEQYDVLVHKLMSHGYQMDPAEAARIRRELSRGTYGEVAQ